MNTVALACLLQKRNVKVKDTKRVRKRSRSEAMRDESNSQSFVLYSILTRARYIASVFVLLNSLITEL